MIPIFFLLVSGWLFYRLAWSYNKNTLLFTILGTGIYLMLLFSICFLFALMFSVGTGDSPFSFLLTYLQILFFEFRIDLLSIAVIFVPIATFFLIIYKTIEYRWKQEEKDRSKDQELLDG